MSESLFFGLGRPPVEWADSLRVIRLMGFVHLLTASGIHLWALFTISQAMVRTLGRAIGATPGFSAWNWKWLGWGLAFALCFAGWQMSGFRLGLLRPFIIVTLRWGARRLGLRWRAFAPLVISLLIDIGVGIIRTHGSEGPAVDLWSGRIHYALAVGFGLMAMDLGAKHWGLSVGSWLGTAWLDLLLHSQISFWTPVLSLVTIPLFAGLAYPVGILLYFLSPPDFTAWTHGMDAGLEALVRVQAQWPVWLVISRPWVIVSVMGVFVCTMARVSFRRRLILVSVGMIARGLLGCAPARGLDHAAVRSAVQVIQRDVEQGDSAWIEDTDGKIWLIDVGSDRVRPNQVQNLCEWIAKKGWSEIEGVMITHFDRDHWGAMRRLARVIPIHALWVRAGAESDPAFQKLEEQIRGFPFPVLHLNDESHPAQTAPPWLGFKLGRSRGPNHDMMGFAIPLNGGGLYLNAGDSGFAEEAKLPVLCPRPCIFKVSHHGSRFSSSADFSQRLHPDEAWISSGRNSYGHPSPEALSVWRRYAGRVRRTDQEGDLIFPTPKFSIPMF